MLFLSTVFADLRFGARLFVRNLGFSLVAVGSLALGVGASSAIFSVIHAVLLDPYPYRAADRMAMTNFTDKTGRNGQMEYTVADYDEFRRGTRTSEDAILVDRNEWTVTGGIPERVAVISYSPNYFDFMGVPALVGRTPSRRELGEAAAPPQLATISYLFWQKHFHGSRNAINTTLSLNHQLYAIVGVLPPRFTWSDADVYVPMPMVTSAETFFTMVRLRPGVSLGALDKELQIYTERFQKRSSGHIYPKDFKFATQHLNDALLGKFKGTLLILMAAVTFLLLIACGNVSILLLARATERYKEISTRLSLGASRKRIIRQLLTESVALSLVGGIAGVLLAYRGVPAIVALMPEYSVPHEAVIQVNGIVVFFTFFISVGTGVLFGLAPALQLARPDLRSNLQEGSRSVAGGSVMGRTRNLLIVAEVSLTMVLLVGAGVAIRGFWALLEKPLGFQPDHVLTLFLSTQVGTFKTWEARKAFYDEILETFRSTPGVTSAATTVTALPPWVGYKTVAEMPAHLGTYGPQPMLVGVVGDEYFQTVRVPLLAGRDFTTFDMQHNSAVAIINDQMRRKYWPGGQSPIGEKVRLPEMDFKGSAYVYPPPNATQTFEVIGVVGTALNRGLQDKPEPAVYVPYGTLLPPGCVFLVRTQGDPKALIQTLREKASRVNPDQPISEVRTLDEDLTRQGMAYPRFSTTLFSIFAVVALSLAGAGIYSVVSYAVTRRTREFGIRMALGARAADVLAIVSGMTARLMLVGIVLGLVASLLMGRVISQYVEGWNPRDPVAFAGVTLVLLVAAAIACYVPVRRAVRIQPMTALRHE